MLKTLKLKCLINNFLITCFLITTKKKYLIWQHSLRWTIQSYKMANALRHSFCTFVFQGNKDNPLNFHKNVFFFVRGFRTYLCWYWVHWTIQNNKLYFCYVPLWSSPWMLGHTCTCCWTQLMDQPGPFQLIPKVSKPE